jgi:hypothetical protein
MTPSGASAAGGVAADARRRRGVLEISAGARSDANTILHQGRALGNAHRSVQKGKPRQGTLYALVQCEVCGHQSRLIKDDSDSKW